jgi:uncharacterized protein
VRTVWRYLLMGFGTVAVVMGVVGIFVPMWPTTPFLLLAVVCYVRSSDRMYQWLLSHRHLGKYVRDYASGEGIPRRAKAIALSLMWVTTTMSSGIMVLRFGRTPWTAAYAFGLAAIAIGVHYYIGYRIPTRRDE